MLNFCKSSAIEIISKSQIRYKGTLKYYDKINKAFVVINVKSMGTEDRNCIYKISESNNLYDTLSFKVDNIDRYKTGNEWISFDAHIIKSKADNDDYSHNNSSQNANKALEHKRNELDVKYNNCARADNESKAVNNNFLYNTKYNIDTATVKESLECKSNESTPNKNREQKKSKTKNTNYKNKKDYKLFNVEIPATDFDFSTTNQINQSKTKEELTKTSKTFYNKDAGFYDNFER